MSLATALGRRGRGAESASMLVRAAADVDLALALAREDAERIAGEATRVRARRLIDDEEEQQRVLDSEAFQPFQDNES